MKRVLIACTAILFVLISLWRVSKMPSFQFMGELVHRVETGDRVVALTFDDGPGIHNTEEILGVLREEAIHATFFLIGKNVEENLGLAKMIMNEGHQVGNHSYSHKRMLLNSVDFCRSEIAKTDGLLRGLGYQDEIVFRPPFGKKLFSLPAALSELDKLSVTWDVDSEDTETQDPKILEDNVLSEVRPGSIILFHDGFAKKPGTISAVKNVIKVLKAQGYTFLTVNELRKNGLRHALVRR
ncbi:MAG: polysaccharide deacetylase family protein [Bdellovibrionia bacterium]